MNHAAVNLTRIRQACDAACLRTGRDPRGVRLLVVSKTRDADAVRAVADAGQLLFGENRVQEARDKIPLVARAGLEWHLIGPLQRNKAHLAVQLFGMIQSVDSVELAQELSKRAERLRPLPVLLQVNVGREPQKSGLMPEETLAAVRAMAPLPGIAIRGVMTIPPFDPEPEASRPWFRALARLAGEIRDEGITGVGMAELSMGMSHDFVIAVEEGATLVRVGSAVFNQS